MANIVQFENVGLRYGVGEETLCDVSFTLRSGQFHFLKKSLVLLLACIIRLRYPQVEKSMPGVGMVLVNWVWVI